MLGGWYLLLFVNWMTAILGVGNAASYVLVYTPLKRKTTLEYYRRGDSGGGAADDGMDGGNRIAGGTGIGAVRDSVRLANPAFPGHRDVVSG